MRPPADIAALAALIERIVDDRVESRLRELGVTSGEYSSSALPMGVTARTFAAWCRSGRVACAKRDGRGWRCSREGWESARATGPNATPRTPANDGDVLEDADALLRRAGLRATRGRR